VTGYRPPGTMLKRADVVCLGVLVLAAAATVWISPALANRANDMLVGKSDAARNRFFARFLHASGANCGRVGRNFFQGQDRAGDAFWNVACANGKSYAIMLINDNSGSTRIMPCDQLNRLHSSRCFQKFTAGE
jgi:hypothetical protein